MVGLITAPLGSPDTIQGLDISTLPSSVIERVDPLETLKQIGRFVPDSFARYGVTDPESGMQIVPPAPTEPKEELERKWGIAGPTPGLSLHFDSDLPESVAIDMNQAKRDEIARASAQQRSPGGVGSTLADLGYGFLDPVGLAAAALPVFGEARVGALLARAGIDFGEGIAGRTALRALTGAADASVSNLPLVAARYGMSQQEHADYGMLDAAKDVAYGALLGSVVHPVTGALGDWVHGRAPALNNVEALAANPDLDAAAMHAKTASVLEDRPADVGPFLDAAAATHAEDELGRWTRAQQAIDADTEAAQRTSEIEGTPDRSGQIANARERLEGLRDDVAGFQEDLTAAQERAARSALGVTDPETAARLAAIEDELGGTIPAARRADLLAEQQILLQGQPNDAPAAAALTSALERARDEAQIRGLSTALERARAAGDVGQATAIQSEISDVQRRLAQSTQATLDASRDAAQAAGLRTGLARTQAAAAQAQADLERLEAADRDVALAEQARRLASDRQHRIDNARLDSRREVAQALAERTIHRLGRQWGYTLPQHDVSELAAAVLRGEISAADAIESVRRWRGEAITPDTIGLDNTEDALAHGMARFRTEAAGAAADLTRSPSARLAAGEIPPEEAATLRQADAAAAAPPQDLPAKATPLAAAGAEGQSAPAAIGRLSPEMARMMADAEQQITRAQVAGLLSAADEAELRAMDEEAGRSQARQGAIMQAAACVARGMV